MFRPQDKELWKIIENVPKLEGAWPYVAAILCLVLPGTGTMLAACAGYNKYWSKTQLFVGLLQMLTAPFLIGWIWSWWWGW